MNRDADGLELVHLLRATTVQLQLQAARFGAAHGLHPTDVRALIALLDAVRAQRPATPGYLVAELGLNSASVTALVDRLERLGHVRRERDPADRRRVLLVVSDQATELGWAWFGPLIDAMLVALRSFSAEDLSAVRRFLELMERAASEAP
ncbi:MAG TPA: MarR family transcriptional regulator [Mycobacteriales bacterium]|nr:MarR family transcriptional regulator [Mycobacteriales bacterium]